MPFGVALGHRLRQVREEEKMTAADVATYASRWLGLGWDRSTVTRIELGQRQITAVELLTLPVLFGRPIVDLLPAEPCQLTDDVGADPDVLRYALTRGARGYDVPKRLKDLHEAEEKLRPTFRRMQKRFPNVPGILVLGAAKHVRDEVTVKAARRLDADPWDVAVAAMQLWDRGLRSERDKRVGEKAETMRARQARRGHVTRQLLEELRPAIAELQAARMHQTEEG